MGSFLHISPYWYNNQHFGWMAVLGKWICWSFATTLVNWTPLGDHLMVFENKHTWWCSCLQSTHLQATVLSMEPIWKQFQPQKAGTTFAGWNAKVHCHRWEQFPELKTACSALLDTHKCLTPPVFDPHFSFVYSDGDKTSNFHRRMADFTP